VLLGGKRHALGGSFFERPSWDGCHDQDADAREGKLRPWLGYSSFQRRAAIAMANVEIRLGRLCLYARSGANWRVSEAVRVRDRRVWKKGRIEKEVTGTVRWRQANPAWARRVEIGILDYNEIKYVLSRRKQPVAQLRGRSWSFPLTPDIQASLDFYLGRDLLPRKWRRLVASLCGGHRRADLGLHQEAIPAPSLPS